MAQQELERVYRIVADGTQAINQLDKIAKSANNIDSKMAGIASTMKTAFVAIGSATAILQFGKAILSASENVANLKGSFKALLGDGERASDMLERVYAIVQNTGAPVEDVASSVQRLSIGLKEMGGTNEQIQLVAENFIKLGRVSGSSMQDISGALQQFNQGLASGKLQGDELRSIAERLPGIIKLIAEEMGVSVGEVKKLGSEGKITADIMANALLRATGKINEDFKEMPITFDQSMNRMKLTWNQFLQKIGGTSDLMMMINETIDYINDGLKDVKSNMSAIGLIGSAVKVAFQAAVVLVSDLSFVVTTLASDASRLITVIGLALKGNFGEIPAVWSQFSQEQIKARGELDKFQSQILGASAPVSAIKENVKGTTENVELFGKSLAKSGDGAKKAKEELSAINELLKDLKKTGDDRSRAVEQLAYLEKLSPEKMKALGVSLYDVAESKKKLNEVIDPQGSDLKKFADGVKESLDPMIEMQKQVDKLGEAYQKTFLTEEEYVKSVIEAYDQAAEKLKKNKEGIDEIGVAIGNSLSNSVSGFVDVLFDANKSFQDFISTTLVGIGKLIMQMLILRTIKMATQNTSLGSFLFSKNATGNAFAGSTGLPQGVYSTPTFFAMPQEGFHKFANGGVPGLGVLAEAGRSEAIVPLVRHGADLGVKASPVIVNVNNTMSETADVRVQETNKADGSKQIEVMIVQKIKQAIADGSLDRSFRGAYGFSRNPS